MPADSLLEELESLVVITGDKRRIGLYARAADRIRELEEAWSEVAP